MRASLRRGIAVCVALPLTILLAAPVAHAVENGPADQAALDGQTLVERVQAAAEVTDTTEQLAAAVSLPEDGPGSLSFDEADRVTVSVLLDRAPDAGLLASIGEIAEVDTVLELFRSVTVRVDPDRLLELQAVPGVLSATPALAPEVGRSRDVNALSGALGARVGGPRIAAETPGGDVCGPIPIEADTPLRAAEARDAFDVDGTGVTIGILSDSYGKRTTPTTPAEDVASGALPGPGNPCGRQTPVDVLSDQSAGGTDEGRAMAQLVHGIAPGAELKFADSGQTEFEMAQHILDLREAGADIIVDDISWGSETQYQRGFISWAIEQVTADGAAYFTSAGNSTADGGSNVSLSSWQTAAYRATACPDWLATDPSDSLAGAVGIDCLDFDPDPTTAVPFDTLEVADETTLSVIASVGEPFAGVTTGYQIRFYEWDADAETAELLNIVPSFGAPYPGAQGNAVLPAESEVRMVLVRTAHDSAEARPPAFEIMFMRGADQIASRAFMGDGVNDWVGEGVWGHAADGSAVSVAALDWEDPTAVRPYSSLGPGTLLFETVHPTLATPSARLAAPEIVDVPSVAAVDGTQTTFFGGNAGTPEAPEYRFYGTSAAAPHAAAVAALGKQAAPEMSGDELTDLVIDTARGTAEGGPINPWAPRFADKHVFGAGIVDAMALLEAIPVVPGAPAGLEVVGLSEDSVGVDWLLGDDRVDSYVLELTDGDDLVERVDLPADAVHNRFDGLQPNREYTATLTAISEDDESAEATATGATLATTPRGLALDRATASSLRVTWSEDSAPSRYRVSIETAGSGSGSGHARAAATTSSFVEVESAPAGTTSYEFGGLSADTAYTVTISALNIDTAESSASIDARTAKAEATGGGAGGGSGAEGAKSGSGSPLAATGGDAAMPLAVASAALLLLGAVVIAAAAARRRRGAEVGAARSGGATAAGAPWAVRESEE